MRLAFFGDVVGRSGREGLAEHLPGLRRRLGLEFVVVNAENAAAGFGITENTAKELFNAGADCLTLGNHSWDQKEALTYIVREPRLIRPLNYPAFAQAPGRGAQLFATDEGRNMLVINLLGRVHMDALDDPFAAVDRELEACPLGHRRRRDHRRHALRGDLGEDGDGPLLRRPRQPGGRHPHPRADRGRPDPARRHGLPDRRRRLRRLRQRDRQPEGRAAAPLHHPHLAGPLQAGRGPGDGLRGLLETDDATGLARRIEPIRVGGRLSPTVPAV